MKKEYQEIISEYLGVEPVMINSALVSAQNRVRLYWTNIAGIEQPKDKGIVLKDILEDVVNDEYNVGQHLLDGYKGGDQLNPNYKSQANTIHRDKTATLCAGTHGYSNGYVEKPYSHREPKVLCGRIVGRKINPNTGKRDDYNPDLKAEQRLEPRLDEKSGTLTTVQKDNVLIVPEATKKGFTEIQDGDCFDATYINSKTRRGRNMKYKSNCLTAMNYAYMKYEHPTYRKLTPLECERLQTVPDGYTSGVSNTQRYKLLGNGFTVDIIKHILQEMIQ
jgi:DNA (cytosine-5)-methyltransferase 3A